MKLSQILRPFLIGGLFTLFSPLGAALPLAYLGLPSELMAYSPEEQVIHLKKCKGCYLRNAKFAELNLSQVDLTGSNLSYANLRGATLTGAKLEGCDLTGANLTGALWIDGVTICQKGSIGFCNPEKPKP